MNHLPIVPILIPLAGALLLLAWHPRGIATQRAIGVGATLALVASLFWLLPAAQGPVTYALGDWQAPFGILLILDPLAAVMVATTAVLGLAALLHASRGDDDRGLNFHALFQFQLMGLNGAFLTGDLFNLFVFFEILLIASYGLLIHGGGGVRSRAAVHYVILNLAGSAVFLLGLGMVYASLGTLNMADAGRAMAALGPDEGGLAAMAVLLLVVVFGLKAALIPLHFWLTRAYTAATPAVAALFAVMTKVGVYALLRLTDAVGAPASLDPLLRNGLLVLGLVTLTHGALGALGATRLAALVARLVIASVGTLLIGIGIGGDEALTAAVYYLVHSTWAAGALFLLAGLIAEARGSRSDRIGAGPPGVLGSGAGLLFVVAAVGMVGLPPLGGFLGKVLLLQAAADHAWQAAIWTVVLATGLVMIVAAARAGSIVFWRLEPEAEPGPPVTRGAFVPATLLVGGVVAWALAAAPAAEYAATAAEWMARGDAWRTAVLP
ncbi:monovalent cation/H+ antiporter subunit D [Thiohalospira sp.]|uniref:monovalent cation/H+ antiporter subunit D n=1 Tax=Thiohalospira sp. TaxID=3080549 RepID=UPI00397F1A1C